MNSKFLYLDESGDGGWPEGYGGASKGRYFVFAGAIVDGEQNISLRNGVEEILKEYFPLRSNRPEELHYADLVHDKGLYRDLPSAEKKQLADDVFDLITNVDPTVMGTVADKQRMKERYGEDAYPPKRYAFRATVDRFNKHLEAKNMVGTVTIDADESFDRKLRRLVYNAKDQGIDIGGSRKGSSTVPRIMDTITLSPSEMSAGIQIADFIAYVIRHQYEYGGSDRFEEIEHLMRDPEAVSLTEPSVVPR